ncbi:MAG: RluA family pseudouridine synthase [Victivallaceae bacterium]|nr:RluA family pseudouridine synthase [Victivallaceae bacterium]
MTAMEHSPGERRITTVIDDRAAGKRLDLWLAERFTYLSRNQWQQQIKAEKLLLNDRKTRSSRILQLNEQVTFISDRPEPPIIMEYSVVYEDEHFFVVNKGGNLPCHPAGPFFKHTLWYDMTEKYGKVFIANRLDRETSGLMLVGKNTEIATKLAKLFTSRKISKKYQAIVFGQFTDEIIADGYLIDDPASEVRKKRQFAFEQPEPLSDKAESATTRLNPITQFAGFSLVEAVPTTGRLHQIRATLYSLGYPLVGDKLYGPDDTVYLRLARDEITAADREKLLLPRQALHATNLEFIHPITGKAMNFQAPLPSDMQNFIAKRL